MSTQAVTCPVCGREVRATLGVIGTHGGTEFNPFLPLCGGTGRKVALAQDPRDTALQGTWTRAGCIAHVGKARPCGEPAPILDRVRGGYVCRLHQPDLPSYLSFSPAGVLEFDVPEFIRGAGLTDTLETRESVAEAAVQVLRQTFPEVPAILAVKAS